jgi:hypothetical protein
MRVQPDTAAGRVRRVAYVVVSAVVVCAVVSATVAACGRAHGAPKPDRPPAAVQPAVPVTRALPADVVPMVLPATGADTRLTQGLDAFLLAVRYRALHDCVQAHGLAMPDVPPPMFVRYLDIPDLAYIRVHGFATGAGPVPPVPVPATGGTPSAAQRQCMSTANDADRAVRALVRPLREAYLAALSTLPDRPEVEAAYRDLGGCLRAHGFAASDEQDFFAQVDSRLHALDGRPGRAAAEHELAVAYADCMGPVEAVREPLRGELRAAFVAGHATEVDALRSTLAAGLHDLERRYGVAIAFPTV